jgi:hypothetical protein
MGLCASRCHQIWCWTLPVIRSESSSSHRFFQVVRAIGKRFDPAIEVSKDQFSGSIVQRQASKTIGVFYIYGAPFLAVFDYLSGNRK